jgi:hypothetical protein
MVNAGTHPVLLRSACWRSLPPSSSAAAKAAAPPCPRPRSRSRPCSTNWRAWEHTVSALALNVAIFTSLSDLLHQRGTKPQRIDTSSRCRRVRQSCPPDRWGRRCSAPGCSAGAGRDARRAASPHKKRNPKRNLLPGVSIAPDGGTSGDGDRPARSGG